MTQKSVILNFPKSKIDRPVISTVIRKMKVEVNILQAHITPEEDGHMFAIFSGEGNSVEEAFDYLRGNEISVVLPTRNLVRDEEKCVHCTACVGQCPSAAFEVSEETWEVIYNPKRCIACKLCIPSCGFGALVSLSDHFKKTGVL